MNKKVINGNQMVRSIIDKGRKGNAIEIIDIKLNDIKRKYKY